MHNAKEMSYYILHVAYWILHVGNKILDIANFKIGYDTKTKYLQSVFQMANYTFHIWIACCTLHNTVRIRYSIMDTGTSY